MVLMLPVFFVLPQGQGGRHVDDFRIALRHEAEKNTKKSSLCSLDILRFVIDSVSVELSKARRLACVLPLNYVD